MPATSALATSLLAMYCAFRTSFVALLGVLLREVLGLGFERGLLGVGLQLGGLGLGVLAFLDGGEDLLLGRLGGKPERRFQFFDVHFGPFLFCVLKS